LDAFFDAGQAANTTENTREFALRMSLIASESNPPSIGIDSEIARSD
jgi:hypothetical protein